MNEAEAPLIRSFHSHLLYVHPSVPQPPGAAAQCVAGDQGLHPEGLQRRNRLPLPDQVPLGARQQGERTKHTAHWKKKQKTHRISTWTSVRVFLQIDRANFAGGDGEDAELLLCGGREDRRSVLPGRMSGVRDGVHHLPVHGDAL